MRRRPPSASDLRAAWWAHRAVRIARRRLAAGQVERLAMSTPPPLPDTAVRGLEALLRRTSPTCLEAALVRQRWFAARGVMRDVVIGVTSPREAFQAHAWLDAGPESPVPEPWHELRRLAP